MVAGMKKRSWICKDVERWEDIENHPNYQISCWGRVKSKKRVLVDSLGRVRVWGERFLDHTYVNTGTGYCGINLDYKPYQIHRLVAFAFIPNPENKKCVNHLDGDKTNNHWLNLEWATHKENMAHSVANGTHKTGVRRPDSKLTEEQVVEILRRHKEGVSLYRMAKEYPVHMTTIRSVVLGVSWKHIPRE